MSHDSEGSRAEALGRVADAIGQPVIVVAASWRRDLATDFDHEAARVFVDVLTRTTGATDASVALFLVGRGSHPHFADGVWRACASTGHGYTAVLPYYTAGACSLLALGAERIALHPYAGLGAFDHPLVGGDPVGLGAGVFDDIPALGGIPNHHDERSLVGRLAHGYRHRRRARHAAERILSRRGLEPAEVLGALNGHDLGELGLTASELEALDLSAQQLDAEQAAAAWSLFELYEEALGLTGRPEPRYTESEVGEEVEFELAHGVLGGIIESADASFEYVLDTGRPDPDTGRFDGEWSRGGAEESLALDWDNAEPV